MTETGTETTWTAEPFVPATRSLVELARAARDCRGCPLYADAEQVVFGEGSRAAAIVLVGECVPPEELDTSTLNERLKDAEQRRDEAEEGSNARERAERDVERAEAFLQVAGESSQG